MTVCEWGLWGAHEDACRRWTPGRLFCSCLLIGPPQCHECSRDHRQAGCTLCATGMVHSGQLCHQWRWALWGTWLAVQSALEPEMSCTLCSFPLPPSSFPWGVSARSSLHDQPPFVLHHAINVQMQPATGFLFNVNSFCFQWASSWYSYAILLFFFLIVKIKSTHCLVLRGDFRHMGHPGMAVSDEPIAPPLGFRSVLRSTLVDL